MLFIFSILFSFFYINNDYLCSIKKELKKLRKLKKLKKFFRLATLEEASQAPSERRYRQEWLSA